MNAFSIGMAVIGVVAAIYVSIPVGLLLVVAGWVLRGDENAFVDV